MTQFSRIPIRDLVDDERTERTPAPDSEVWNLNLDQIESGSGRILSKLMVSPKALGPSTYPFKAGTILYSKLRPYLNKVAVVDSDGYATTELVPLRCDKDRVLPSYFAYFLRSPEFLSFANTVVAGAKMPRMVMSEFWKYKVPLPPLPEQRRIAAILDKADALRSKRREALAQLDRLAQSIFVEMFGDPVTNPKRWPVVELAAVIADGDSINYGVIQPGDDVPDGIPLIRVGDLIDGRVCHGGLKKIHPSIESAYKRSRLRGDEILVSCVGSVGVVALATENERNFNIARAVARIRLSDLADRYFVAAQLQSKRVQLYFKQELRTVSQPTLNIKQIAETLVTMPPIELQRKFASRVHDIERIRARYLASRNAIDALFSSIQHHVFRGRL